MSKAPDRCTRRGFLQGASLALLAGGCGQSEISELPGDPAGWWRPGGFVVHEAVDSSGAAQGIVRARIDGTWRSLHLSDLPERFVRWSLGSRIARIEKWARSGFDFSDLAGPHNGCVATYGGPTRDSTVSLNTAYKGMGFVPLPDRIEAVMRRLDAAEQEARALDDPGRVLARKVAFLGDLYADSGIFDRRKQISLELFAEPDHPTHTFLNMMSNPIASVAFLDFPAFEIRAVPELIHPGNPDLDRYRKNLAAYANRIHDFVHSGQGPRLACIYHVIEVFDDTPNASAKGRRIA